MFSTLWNSTTTRIQGQTQTQTQIQQQAQAQTASAFLAQIDATEEIVEAGDSPPVFTHAFKAAFVEQLAAAVSDADPESDRRSEQDSIPAENSNSNTVHIKKVQSADTAIELTKQRAAVDANLARIVGAPFTVLVAGLFLSAVQFRIAENILGGAGLGKSALVNAVLGVSVSNVNHMVAQRAVSSASSFLDPAGWARVIDSAGFARSSNSLFSSDHLLQFMDLATSADGASHLLHIDMIWYLVDHIQPDDVSVMKALLQKQIPFLVIIAKCDSKSASEIYSIRSQVHALLSPQLDSDDATANAIDTIIHNLDLDAPVRGWDVVEFSNPPVDSYPKCQECGSVSVLADLADTGKKAWFCSKDGCLFSAQYYLKIQDTRSLKDSLSFLSGAINSLLGNIPTRRLQIAKLLDATPKKKAAIRIVTAATLAAAGIGAAPIPFADTPLLLATQYTMILAICRVFGVRALGLNDSRFYVSLLAASPFPFLGILAAGAAKAIPGVGSVGAAIVEAPIAGGLTMAMGVAVIQTCVQLHKARIEGRSGGDMEFLFDQDVQKLVQATFKNTAAWIRRAVTKRDGFSERAVGDYISHIVDGSEEVPVLTFDARVEDRAHFPENNLRSGTYSDVAVTEVAVDIEKIKGELAERPASEVA
ncbi:hypothetical protein HK100_001132, partial [Physocladia obscura]